MEDTWALLCLFWQVSRCLRGYVYQTTIFSKNSSPQARTRLTQPSFWACHGDFWVFLCESFHRSSSISALSIYLQSALTSSWLEFDFYPAWSKGPSWQVLWDYLWVPRHCLPASILSEPVSFSIKLDYNDTYLIKHEFVIKQAICILAFILWLPARAPKTFTIS